MPSLRSLALQSAVVAVTVFALYITIAILSPARNHPIAAADPPEPSGPAAASLASNNFALIGQVTKVDGGTFSAGQVVAQGNLVYVTGNLSGTQTLAVINAAVPFSPTLAGYDKQHTLRGNLITVKGTTAYLTEYVDIYNGGASFQIADVSTPAAPSQVFSTTYNFGPLLAVAASGSNLYLVHSAFNFFGGGQSVGGLVVLSPPSSPKLVGGYGLPYAIYNDAMGYAGIGIGVSGNYVFMVDRSSGKDSNPGVRSVDVSTPTTPTQAGYLKLPGAGSFVQNGNYLYIIQSVSTASWNLAVVDISNPKAPSAVGTVQLPGQAGGSIAYANGHVFAIYGSAGNVPSGVRAINVASPSAPADAGFYEGFFSAVSAQGSMVYLAAGSNGLIILELGGSGCGSGTAGISPLAANACVLLTGKVKRLDTGAPVVDALVSAHLVTSTQQFSTKSLADGTFSLGLPSGRYAVTATAPGLHVYGTVDPVTPPKETVSLLMEPDLSLVAIEAVQVVQNWQNDVPLYRGKPTIVRIYLRNDGAAAFGSVSGVLTVTRAGSVIAVFNSPSNKGPVWVPVGPPDRATTNATPFFALPVNLLDGTLTFEFGTLTAGGKPMPLYCDDSAPPDIQDCRLTVTFAAPPRAKAVFLAVESYDDNGTRAVPNVKDVLEAMRKIRDISPMTQQSFEWTIGPLLQPYPALTELWNPVLPLGDAYAWARLLTNLSTYKTLHACASLFYVGCNTDYIGVLTGATGSGTVGLDSPFSGVLAGYVHNGLTLPHEYGHANGRYHVKCTISTGPSVGGAISYFTDPRGVIATNSVEQFKYDGFDIPNDRAVGPDTCDLMSYGYRWPSKYTYTGIAERLQSRFGLLGQAEPTPQDALLVTGIITPAAGTASFDTVLATKLAIPTVPITTTYQLQIETAGGSVLGTYGIADDDGADVLSSTFRSFVAIVPFSPLAGRIRLVQNGQTLLSRDKPVSPPAVTLVSPIGGETWSGNSATVRWSTTSLALQRYAVELSLDGGSTWAPLAFDLTALTTTVDLNWVAGSSQALVRVLASDGFSTAASQSAAVFTIANRPPVAAITTPAPGSQFWSDQVINFTGEGFDLRDGPLGDTALTWQSSLSGTIGSGRALTVRASSLPPGVQVITMTAKNSLALTAAATITITISQQRPVLPTRPVVSPDPLVIITARGRTAETSLLLGNDGDGTYTASLSSDLSWLKFSQTSGQLGDRVIIRADPIGKATGLYTGTVTVKASGFAPIHVPVQVLVEAPGPVYVPSAVRNSAP